MTTDKLKLLVETVQKLSLARDLPTIMQVVRTSARKLTGADGATFILKDRDRCYYADEDAIEPLWKGQKFPMSACVSGWAMMHKEAVVIEDIYNDARVPIDAYRPTFVKSLAVVPIRTMDPVGAIGNYWAHRYEPTAAELQLLQSLADIASVSIENVQVYSELEERVRLRTQQLEDLNKELEAFSYSVSHDLRAPIRSINGFTTILMEDYGASMNEEARQLMQSIIGGAERMNRLIDELISFARLGQKPMNKTKIDMNDLVQSVLSEVKNSMHYKADIRLGTLHEVHADYGLLYQVMLNLVSNAIKYSSKKDNAVVEIYSQLVKNEVVFSVRDNGAGFNMQYADKLFGTFQRLHSQSEFEGTGIGLALVQRIIHKHGGRVWADAKVDEGATFSFALPTLITEPNYLN